MNHGQAGIGRHLHSCLAVPPRAGGHPFRRTLLGGTPLVWGQIRTPMACLVVSIGDEVFAGGQRYVGKLRLVQRFASALEAVDDDDDADGVQAGFA